jgi:hypothetical protein
MSKRDSSTGRFASAQHAINDERMTTDIESLFGTELDIGRSIAYLVGSMIWGYALGCAATVVLDAIWLLAIPTVFQVIATIVVVVLAVYIAALTSYFVSKFTVDTTIKAAEYVGAKFSVAKQYARNFEFKKPAFLH